MKSIIELVENNMLSGIYEELANTIGVDNAYKVYLVFHGQQRSFPQYFYKPSYVKTMIKKEYTGTNCKKLAKKYNYSERYMRQLIRDAHAEMKEDSDNE